ncbi:MAG: sulfotransferase family protein, partial [Terriglobia bacterium]
MFVLSEAEPHPQLASIAQIANEFVLAWRTVWFGHGTDPAGHKEYRRLLVEFLANMRRSAAGVRLKNHALLVNAVTGLLGQAIRDQTSAPSDEYAGEDHELTTPRVGRSAASAVRDEFDRPVFIVSPPRSGSSLLFETLSLSPTACTIGGEGHAVIEGASAAGLGAAVRGYSSNRLEGDDATPEVAELVRERFRRRALDRQGQKRPGRIRLLEKTPKNALRLPFLTRVFSDAQFIYLHRDAREVLASMMEAWESGRFRTYPELPGWTGCPWSMVLVPGWRQLIGKSLPEIVAAQWETTTRILLDDLETIPAERWTVASYDELLSDPRAEIAHLCKSIDFEWDQPLDGKLPLARHTLSTPGAGKWRMRAR